MLKTGVVRQTALLPDGVAGEPRGLCRYRIGVLPIKNGFSGIGTHKHLFSKNPAYFIILFLRVNGGVTNF